MKGGMEPSFCIGAYSKKLYGIFSLKRKGVLRENESRSFSGICFFAEILFCDERQKDIRIVRVVFDLLRPAPYVFGEIFEYGQFP